MPDGKRKRRFSTNPAKRAWYANHRSLRFARRFSIGATPMDSNIDSNRVDDEPNAR